MSIFFTSTRCLLLIRNLCLPEEQGARWIPNRAHPWMGEGGEEENQTTCEVD